MNLQCFNISVVPVEQIYLLPTDRRLQCKHMTAIQLERNALDLEMKEIRREQQELNDKLSQIMIMRKDLCSAGICMDSNFGIYDLFTFKIISMLQLCFI